MTDARRALPSVDRLLAHPELAAAAAGWSRRVVLAVAREAIERARNVVAGVADGPSSIDALASACADRLARLREPSPRRVINATGVVIHTNLGRAPLAAPALLAASDAARDYCDLEYSLGRGERGSRHGHVDRLLAVLFPGRAALVVNNNAAALLLALNTFALGREVIVSRGELVEIGGSFRIPDILERSGARLAEVGTTNRTHLADYRRAVRPETGLLLKVWPSNYRVIGFTAEVAVPALAELARDSGVPLVVDQGCGRLFRDAPGPSSERSIEELLEDGADLVCFSGDKMLGGPQAGILVGTPDLVRQCATNPLTRALRPDKLTLAALAATCLAWASDDPAQHIPAARMLAMTADGLREHADQLARALAERLPGATIDVAPGVSRVGGGAAPEEDLPTWLVTLRVPGLGEDTLLAALRRGPTPLVARAQDGAVVFDARTLIFEDAADLATLIAAAAENR